MEIRVGRFTLKSDTMCFWIEEEYIGKDAKGKEKKQTRRVAGYASSLDNLYRQFVEHRHKASEAQTVTELIKEMKQTAEDIEMIRKTATANDFRKLRKIGKQIKEINNGKSF